MRLAWLGGIFVLFSFLCNAKSTTAETKNVLILLPGPTAVPVTIEYLTGLQKVFRSNPNKPINIYIEHLNLQQFPQLDYEQTLIKWLQTKYSKIKFDVVITVLRDSFEFTEKWRDTLWPNTPVVFGLIDLKDRKKFQPGFTGVHFLVDFLGTVEAALKLQPETQNLALISGASKQDKFNLQYTITQLEPLKKRLKFIYISGLSFRDILERVSHLPERTIILNLSPILDGSGQIIFSRNFYDRVRPIANRPIYDPNNVTFGVGPIGGILTEHTTAGVETAQLVLRILNGESASNISPETTKSSRLTLDWRQLQRWKIPESRIPANAIVRFREQSFWLQYKWPITAAIAFMILQSFLIAALLRQNTMRKKAEEAEKNAKLETQQHRLEIEHVTRAATMGELASSLAHELNQPLTAILSNAQAARRFLNTGTTDLNEIQEILKDIAEDDLRAREIISRIRSLLKKEEQHFEPVELNEVVGTVLHVIKDELSVMRVSVETQLSANLQPIKGDSVQLQQVFLNLLLNARDAVSEKNEGERKVILKTWMGSSDVNLSVQDTGKGIEPEKLNLIFEPFFSTKQDGLGMGLSISKTIMQAHDGKIWAESEPAQGTTFYCRFPYITL